MKALRSILAAVVLTSLCACHTIDDERVPVAPVNLVFQTQAQWILYGTPAAMDYRSFIRDSRVPANFPYTASSYTGFGGILLVGDVMGTPQAYDLCCPVECKKNIIVKIDPDDNFLAKCNTCGSTYNVFSLLGHPVSGPAATEGYGLRRYHVGQGHDALNYMLVTY